MYHIDMMMVRLNFFRNAWFLILIFVLGLNSSLLSLDVRDYKSVDADLSNKILLYSNILKNGDDELKTKLEFKKGEPFLLEGMSKEEEAGLERVAAYDVGSTGVKFKLADVDRKTRRIVNEIYAKNWDTEKSLGFDINEDNYADRVAIMAGFKALVEEYFPSYSDVTYVAVATSGFRKAEEKGKVLERMIREMTGVDFKIIDQKEEGLLAYYGVRSKVKDFDPLKDVVWDIGGGSSQFVLSKKVNGKHELLFYGVGIGRNRFDELVRRMVKKYGEDEIKSKKSPNPMTREEVNEAINLAEFFLKIGSQEIGIKSFTDDEIKEIREKVLEGGKVYATGAVRKFGKFRKTVTKLKGEKNEESSSKTYYTKDDIKRAIDEAVGKTDDEIFEDLKGKKGQVASVKSDVTSLILVYSIMDVLGIKGVYPVEAGSTDGLIIKTVLDENVEESRDDESL